MQIADNLAQAVAAVGGLAGFVALGIELWTRARRKKRPPEGLLIGLNWLHDAFGDIIGHGGEEPTWFLDDERRRQESILAILNGQIVDDELNKHVGDARARFQEAWTLSVGHRESKKSGGVDWVERQLECAARGREVCVRAIDRANELVRKHGS